MKKYIDQTIQAGKEVYANRWYLVVTIAAAAILYSSNALVRNYRLLFSYFSFSLLWTLIKGLGVTFTWFGLISLIFISSGAAVVFTFSIYLLRRQIQSAAGLPGIAAAVLAPACPACALNLFGVIGLGSIVTFLPLQGAELNILGMVIVVLSLVYVAGKVVARRCELR